MGAIGTGSCQAALRGQHNQQLPMQQLSRPLQSLFVRVDSGDDDATRESAAVTVAIKAFVLLLGLAAYTFGPLLVNWSVVVQVPLEGEATVLTLPARDQAKQWFGVTLAHQPGMAKLYVEDVSKGGAAGLAGVLPGDIVARGEQDGVTIFDQSSFSNQDALLEVQGFIEKHPYQPHPKLNPPLIDPAKPFTVTFDMEHVDVKKGDAYLGFGIVLMQNFVGSCLLLSVYLVCFKGSLSALYTAGNIAILILPGLGWTCADLFEVLANTKTNAALYSVLSQFRLVGTAIVMRFFLGTQQSTAQLTCLVSVTLAILSYTQMPDSVPIGEYWNGFGAPYDPDDKKAEPTDPTGVIYAFAKIALSILMGVVGQKALQKEELKALPLVGLQGLIWSLATVVVLPLMLIFMWITNWEHGIFGGEAVELRHCMKSWDEARCASQTPVVVEQGWDYRTVLVFMFYIFREFWSNLVLRVFDALTKNLVNSAAVVSTYFLSLTMLGKEFNFAKCGLTICIVLQIIQYALIPKLERPPPPSQG